MSEQNSYELTASIPHALQELADQQKPERTGLVETTSGPYTHIGAVVVEVDNGATSAEQDPAQTFLNALRQSLRADSERNIARSSSKPPRTYRLALENLLAIHNEQTARDPENPLSTDDVRRLFANVVRYHQEAGSEAVHPARLAPSFLAALYNAYAQDMMIFAAYPVQTPGRVALLHPPSILGQLEAKCAPHDFMGKKEIVRALASRKADPAGFLDDLLAAIDTFRTVTEPRLREEYGIEGQWDLTFVRELCELSNTEGSARKVLDTIREIAGRYPNARLEDIEAWTKGAVAKKAQKAGALAMMLEGVPSLTWEESDLAAATEQLDRIRETKRERRLGSPTGMKRDAGALRLERILTANWQSSFEHIDVTLTAGRMWHAIKRYDERLDEDQGHLAINTEPENVYAIIVAYARDVAILKAAGRTGSAEEVALFHDPGVYERYKQKYASDALLASSVLAKSSTAILPT